MTPEEIKSMQAYAAAAFGQAEAAVDVIETGDLVVVKPECGIFSPHLSASRDAGAIFYTKLVLKTGRIAVQFQYPPDGSMAWETFNPVELELADIDALHGEMEEMIAEEAAMNEVVAALRVTADEPNLLTGRVIETYEARLNEHKQALEESQARVKRLEETVKNARDTLLWTDTQTWQLSVWQAIQTLTEALLNVNAGSAANAGDESA